MYKIPIKMLKQNSITNKRFIQQKGAEKLVKDELAVCM